MSGWRFRIFGIPITIEPPFLVVLAILGLTPNRPPIWVIEWVLVAGVSVLAHELGHALAYRAFGVAPRIRLYSFGGLTYGAALPTARSIVVSLAGPLAGFAVGGVVWLVAQVLPGNSSAVGAVVRDLLFVNIGWGLFNLLPILPMDGGRATTAVLEALMGHRGELLGRAFSLLAAGGLSIGALLVGQLYITFLAAIFLVLNLQELAELRHRPQWAALGDGWDALGRGEVAVSIDHARRIIGSRASPEIRIAAAELLTWGGLAAGSRDTVSEGMGILGNGAVASELLRAIVDQLTGRVPHLLAESFAANRTPAITSIAARIVSETNGVDRLVAELTALGGRASVNGLAHLQVGLHQAGRYADSARVGAVAVEQGVGPIALYNVACSLARSGDAEGALDWLDRAMSAGFERTAAALADDPDLDSLRATDRFRDLLARWELAPGG
jgi:stage IV sporulation protein FB